ncbi:hypothetical protein F2Q68_00045703 [Brassica cretica]|uniref:Uncharacterized protein n=1 Tax=Brassica cretica TaxID=69181 RepID=A0A8S9LR28_BRACR|nr:hypothetical protein F2Q68_00045703 [Brassica cretica]
MVDSEDRYSTEKASSVQSTILYDCEAEALSKSIHPRQSDSSKVKDVLSRISLSRPVSFFMVKPRFCPSRVQSSPFKSSLGFWPSPLRSTSCFSPRTLFPLSLKIVS